MSYDYQIDPMGMCQYCAATIWRKRKETPGKTTSLCHVGHVSRLNEDGIWRIFPDVSYVS